MPTSHQIVTHLFLQLTVILISTRIVGFLLKKFGQTQVVSEMITGVMLGPSFLGLIAPALQSYLFPKVLNLGLDSKSIPHPSMSILLGLSQLGLVLYMFLIGIEFNTGILSKHWKVAGSISLAGVFSPLIMGAGLGFVLSKNSQLFPANIESWQAALFIGAAMLITAFPMLARIIYESGLANSRLGTLALSGAAFDDAIAWILLAVVLATVKGNPTIALMTIGGGIFYVIGMFRIAKPVLNKFIQPRFPRQQLLGTILLILLICAWLTDAVGIYSIFGAFVVGVILPRIDLLTEMKQKIEFLTVSILLPIFFVYSGLNTQLNILIQPSLLGITILVIFIGFLSKGGACFLGARLGGLDLREAAAIGALMNARGLMELILLNIGLENQVINVALFSVLVLMTICTTCAASPIFNYLFSNELKEPVTQ
jgi:Kef-type K+ transport system membrane component KefB